MNPLDPGLPPSDEWLSASEPMFRSAIDRLEPVRGLTRDDLLQEALLQMLRTWPRPLLGALARAGDRPTTDTVTRLLAGWLGRVADHANKYHARRQQHRVGTVTEDLDGECAKEPGPAFTAAANELQDRAAAVRDALRPDDRALLAFRAAGMSSREIAARLGTTAGAVNSRMTRLHQRLFAGPLRRIHAEITELATDPALAHCGHGVEEIPAQFATGNGALRQLTLRAADLHWDRDGFVRLRVARPPGLPAEVLGVMLLGPRNASGQPVVSSAPFRLAFVGPVAAVAAFVGPPPNAEDLAVPAGFVGLALAG